MSHISTYLSFNGNCREAMTFYQECLGGELHFQTIRSSPLSDKMPEKMKDCILHATLNNGILMIMGSDMVANGGLISGNTVSMLLHCSSEEEARAYYEKLVRGGHATHPLEMSFFGALFGDLTDKYGNCWLLMFDQSHP